MNTDTEKEKSEAAQGPMIPEVPETGSKKPQKLETSSRRGKKESKQEEGEPQKPKKKKGIIRRIFFWVFMLILVVIIAIAILVGLALRLPEKWGLVKSPVEKMFEYTPDRTSAAEILASAEAAGLSVGGIDVYVLREKESDQSALYAILDSSQGFQLNATTEGDPFLDTMVALVRSNAAGEAKVARVSVEYRDASGKPLITLAAPTQAILDFADKKITREAFSESLGGRVDIRNVVEASLIAF